MIRPNSAAPPAIKAIESSGTFPIDGEDDEDPGLGEDEAVGWEYMAVSKDVASGTTLEVVGFTLVVVAVVIVVVLDVEVRERRVEVPLADPVGRRGPRIDKKSPGVVVELWVVEWRFLVVEVVYGTGL